MSEWSVKALSELCEEITVGHVGSMASEYTPSGVPFLRSQNVRKGYLDLGGLKYISPEFHERLRKSRLAPGDIVIVRTGEPGAAALIPNHLGELNCSDLVIARPGKNVDARFLCYSINATAERYVSAHLVGAVQQHFNVGSARNLKISIPPLVGQQAIAEILCALDDKIAVNDKIAAVSDELIRKHYEQAVSSTCQTIKIDDLATQVRDVVSVNSLRREDKYIGLEHIPRRSIWLAKWGTAEAVVSAKNRFRYGDILFGKLRPYFHKVGISFVDGVASTDILVVRPRRTSDLGWLLAAISSDDVVAHASVISDGTRMPRVKWSDLANYQVPWLDDKQATEFNKLVIPLSDRVMSAMAESRNLIALRDALLPKLMSGEIRVRDAEKVVEDVT